MWLHLSAMGIELVERQLYVISYSYSYSLSERGKTSTFKHFLFKMLSFLQILFLPCALRNGCVMFLLVYSGPMLTFACFDYIELVHIFLCHAQLMMVKFPHMWRKDYRSFYCRSVSMCNVKLKRTK